MRRREIRYLLGRVKTNELEGVKLPKLPDGFKQSFESQERFRGWPSFMVTWDVDDSGWQIVMLDKSAEQAWNELLTEKVPALTEVSDGAESNI